jgi:diguanylate cyclase (GGDEF)-like protein
LPHSDLVLGIQNLELGADAEPQRDGMYSQIANLLTASIDDITRKWVDDLRHNTRTEVHKQLLTADIVDGVKGMLASLARAIEKHEGPEDEDEPALLTSAAADPATETRKDVATTRPLYGPLSQAREAAAFLGKLRHKQAYEIQEVIYEYVRLRQEVLLAVRSAELLQEAPASTALAYVDLLLDELMLTTVENFYSTSVRDLEKRAIRDPTTQLYNKDFFQQRLNEELRRAVRYSLPIAIAMIDLDKLKSINDTYGHVAGDEAIRLVATVISTTIRQADVPCRYGGDEFAVILPETSKPQALAFAERVLANIQNLSLMVVPGDPGRADEDPGSSNQKAIEVGKHPPHGALFVPAPKISIGVAAFPEDARNPETLLATADAALYRAKHEGRNKVSG